MLVILVSLVLVIGIAVAVAIRAQDDGPSSPSDWDARVVDLVAFVEEARGSASGC